MNPSVEQVQRGAPQATASPRQSPHAIPGAQYGWLSRLRSYFIFDPLIWFYTLVMGLIAIPAGLFDRDGRLLHGFSRTWSWLIMKTIFCPVKVVGLEKIDTSKPHVYAVNHASALDIPVLYVYLPFQFRIAFKKELLSYPVVGWHLKRSGQVCIDQQNPSHSISSIRAALKGLQAGLPLVIFPEGGRTPDGEIKPFLSGAFFLAIKAQVDIVPVALVGTYEIAPHGYVSHQVSPPRNARRRADFDHQFDHARSGSTLHQSAKVGRRLVLSSLKSGLPSVARLCLCGE